MDTRTKILTADAIPGFDPSRPLLLATGRFDILRTEMVREMEEARLRTRAASLLVVVRPLAGELVPLAARAEMAAALRVIDYVFIAQDEPLENLIAAVKPIETIHLEDADAQRMRQLIEHVHGRERP